MNFLFDYVLISDNWSHFLFRFFLMILNLIILSAITLLFLYINYRRNSFSIVKIICLKRIWISLLTAILLFTVLQPYISVILWGLIFVIFRSIDKKDRLLLYAAEWGEYGVPNYENDIPAKWQKQKQVERWEIDRAHYTLSKFHEIPKGLSFGAILQYYQSLKPVEPSRIINQDRWKQSRLPWKAYFIGTYYISIVNCMYVVRLLNTITVENWIVGLINIYVGISGFVFLLYQLGGLLTSESNGTWDKSRYNFEFLFFSVLFLICWTVVFYQSIVK